MRVFAFAMAAWAGPAHVENVHARKEARTVELLQRSTCRPGVPEQAVARYLDRYGHLDTAAVRRVEAWGATLQPVPAPVAVPTEPALPESPSLAVPFTPPAAPDPSTEP